MITSKSRQEKPWERGSDKQKLSNRTQWACESPPDKAWLAIGSEFCVVTQEGGTKRKQRVQKPCD